MNDKIGMSLAANRIGINYFNLNEFERSLEYHKHNITLSDIENTFAGLYNLGICYRKLNDIMNSIYNFKKSLDWAKQRDVKI